MSSSASLICNFTIAADFGVGVSFRSADDGADYGGLITVYTPATAGPVTTGLWDSDGNVFFTIYDADNPALSCVINSGSVPGSWTPFIEVASESGLTCAISPPQQAPDGSYAYTLTVAQGTSGAAGQKEDSA